MEVSSVKPCVCVGFILVLCSKSHISAKPALTQVKAGLFKLSTFSYIYLKAASTTGMSIRPVYKVS